MFTELDSPVLASNADTQGGDASNWLKRLQEQILSLRRLLGIVVFFALWEILPRIVISSKVSVDLFSGAETTVYKYLVDASFLPPFSTVIKEWWRLVFVTYEIPLHTIHSLRRSFIGLGLGFAISIPLGIAMASFKKLDYYLDPLLQSLRQTSIAAIMPVFLLLFGIKESSKYAIVCWGVWAPLLLNTIAGVKAVDPMLVKAARSMGASRLIIHLRVIVPSALPNVLTGLRLAATSSILVLTVAEMMGSVSGLGFILSLAQIKYQIPKMYAIILTMSIIGIVVNYSLVKLEKSLTRWKPKPS
jgi:NitT/TauT family transport system permease protein